MRAAILVFVAACGRTGFDPIDAAGDGNAIVDVTPDGPLLPIQFDTSSNATATNVATLMWTHTILASKPLLLVAVSDRTNQSGGTAPLVMSVTYGSLALQKVTGDQVIGSLDNLELWALAAPPPGSGQVTVTLASSTAGVSAIAASYGGVAQTGPIDRSSFADAASATAIDVAWTTNKPHEWAFAAAMDQGGFAMTFAPAAGQMSRQLNVSDSQSFELQSAADQADVATPSLVDFHWNSAMASAQWIAVGASFIPAGG